MTKETVGGVHPVARCFTRGVVGCVTHCPLVFKGHVAGILA